MDQWHFTVVICTRDRVDVLRDTVELVLRRLAIYRNAKLVVVDNGSKDGTDEYLRSLSATNGRIFIAHEPIPGIYHARVRGIAHAQGDFILFLDDDMVPGDNWPSALIGELIQNPRVGIVGCAVDPIWEGDRPVWMTDRLAGAGMPKNRMTYRFPRYPFSGCLAFRMCDFVQLFASPERNQIELGWGAQSMRGAGRRRRLGPFRAFYQEWVRGRIARPC